MASPANGRPTGLLSFIYHVTYDSDVTASFNQDPNSTMASFGLTSDEKDAVMAAGNPGNPQDAQLQAVLKLLLPELKDTYHQTW